MTLAISPTRLRKRALKRLIERIRRLLPERVRGELRPSLREDGVVPTRREPAAEVQQAQPPQRFDQTQRRAVKWPELLVAVEKKVPAFPVANSIAVD